MTDSVPLDRVTWPVLDHGYVRSVETWGSDERIVESARMSTGKGFKGWGPFRCGCVVASEDNPARIIQATIPEAVRGPVEGFDTRANYCDADPSCAKCGGKGQIAGDEKFIKFLWTNKHHSPFEQAGMTIEVKAPLFVFREWHRHRTQSYNEMSGRYTVLPDECYVPPLARLTAAGQGHGNKQGSGVPIDSAVAGRMQAAIAAQYAAARQTYEALILDGLAREVARAVLPVSQYSVMRASANLRNWLGFLVLRMPETAQWEIRQYAQVVGKLVGAYFPRTWQLFSEAT